MHAGHGLGHGQAPHCRHQRRLFFSRLLISQARKEKQELQARLSAALQAASYTVCVPPSCRADHEGGGERGRVTATQADRVMEQQRDQAEGNSRTTLRAREGVNNKEDRKRTQPSASWTRDRLGKTRVHQYLSLDQTKKQGRLLRARHGMVSLPKAVEGCLVVAA